MIWELRSSLQLLSTPANNHRSVLLEDGFLPIYSQQQYHVYDKNVITTGPTTPDYPIHYWDPFDDPADVANRNDAVSSSSSSPQTHHTVRLMESSPPLFHTANHRRKIKSAVFGFGRGYSASDWIRFVGSLIATGVDGDIVLGVADVLNSTIKDDGVDEEDANTLLYDFFWNTRRGIITWWCIIHNSPASPK
jgi:hypothetical protein